MASASPPSAPPESPRVYSYDSETQMTVSWLSSQDNGGFPILGYRLYRDSSPAFELDSSQNYLQLSSLSLGETIAL